MLSTRTALAPFEEYSGAAVLLFEKVSAIDNQLVCELSENS